MKYQDNYSEIYSHKDWYDDSRNKKAKKTIAVIRNHLNQDLRNLKLLDVGCYKGEITSMLSLFFGETIGVDIDKKAIESATEKFGNERLEYLCMSGDQLTFEDDTFDVIICSHVYEHVPDSQLLMDQIYRVMKPSGICYFAGGNKYKIFEPHYKLPFLSWVPKFIAHRYLQITGNGDYYYENLLSYWGMKRLVKKFNVIDYTGKIIEDPEKFDADDVIKKGSLKQKIASTLYHYFKFITPTNIWILEN